MLETDKVFAGSIPENYDRYMVPLIFESFAEDIAQRAAGISPRAILETAAGRQSPAWPESRGTTAVPLLGCLVSAHGTVSLSRKKRRRLLADIEDRAFGTARALKTRDPAAAGRTICSVINRALEPKLEFSQQRSATLLRRAVTDREDLKQLDYCIARIVLRAITGQRGARGFREIPYRKMREEWQLISLLQARNKWPARRAS